MKMDLKFKCAVFCAVALVLGAILGFRIAIPLTRADIITCSALLKDYQITLTLDSAYLFDNGALIGVTAHGNDGIDSLIAKDNQ